MYVYTCICVSESSHIGVGTKGRDLTTVLQRFNNCFFAFISSSLVTAQTQLNGNVDKDSSGTATVHCIHCTTEEKSTKHTIHHHLYSDDTQLYITFPPTDMTQSLPLMEACTQKAKTWLCDNGLVMNDSKSQAIVCHPFVMSTYAYIIEPSQHM